jgi:hypothetical protein
MRSVDEEKPTEAPDDVSPLETMPVERLEREITRQGRSYQRGDLPLAAAGGGV